jgi:hypothetical protein
LLCYAGAGDFFLLVCMFDARCHLSLAWFTRVWLVSHAGVYIPPLPCALAAACCESSLFNGPYPFVVRCPSCLSCSLFFVPPTRLCSRTDSPCFVQLGAACTEGGRRSATPAPPPVLPLLHLASSARPPRRHLLQPGGTTSAAPARPVCFDPASSRLCAHHGLPPRGPALARLSRGSGFHRPNCHRRLDLHQPQPVRPHGGPRHIPLRLRRGPPQARRHWRRRSSILSTGPLLLRQ